MSIQVEGHAIARVGVYMIAYVCMQQVYVCVCAHVCSNMWSHTSKHMCVGAFGACKRTCPGEVDVHATDFALTSMSPMEVRREGHGVQKNGIPKKRRMLCPHRVWNSRDSPMGAACCISIRFAAPNVAECYIFTSFGAPKGAEWCIFIGFAAPGDGARRREATSWV